MTTNEYRIAELQEALLIAGRSLETYERSVINLIASDNATSLNNVSKLPYRGLMIQEGLLGKRPFAGSKLHDDIERIAADSACHIFSADYANLQPHSCSQANQAAYKALLTPGDTVLALDFLAGGHLTHGLKSNFSGQTYNFLFYTTSDSGFIDYDTAGRLAKEHSPKMIVCGSSSYPRLFDAKRLREIADSVGAYLMFDLSHEAGLIAAGVIPNPIPLSDITTMSLDKTLRGPFGGMILCRTGLADKVDKAVHPGTQSSFSVRKISDAAHALLETQSEGFRNYAANTLRNAKSLEEVFSKHSGMVITGGTDKHYIVLNVKGAFNISGTEAEALLEKIGILTSRQTLPSDASRKMSQSSGIRLGTAWAASRGYQPAEFTEIGEIIISALTSSAPLNLLADRVKEIANKNRPNDIWLQNNLG